MILEFQPEIPQGLVTQGENIPAHELLLYQALAFGVLSGEEQLARFIEIFVSAFAVPVFQWSRPERILIQLNMFLIRTAKDHPSQSAVTEGQCLRPDPGRLIVPED